MSISALLIVCTTRHNNIQLNNYTTTTATTQIHKAALNNKCTTTNTTMLQEHSNTTSHKSTTPQSSNTISTIQHTIAQNNNTKQHHKQHNTTSTNEFHVASITPTMTNVQSMIFSEDNGGYLAAVFPSYLSQSKIVGFIGGIDVTPVRRYHCHHHRPPRHHRSGSTAKGFYRGGTSLFSVGLFGESRLKYQKAISRPEHSSPSCEPLS